MRIAIEPFMFRKRVSLLDLPAVIASLGFDAMELTPRDDFMPLYVHPRVGSSEIRAFRQSLQQAGVDVVSMLPLYKWSSPDEDERVAAVRYWKRAIQVAVELGCPRLNSDFLGRPEAAQASEAQFFKSMEELLPIFEAEGLKLALEPHPDDFVEDGYAAVNLIRGINSPVIEYIFCAPHVFYMGGDIRGMIRHAGSLITEVHVADTLDHRPSTGMRYLINPPGSQVRVHQHLNIGQGEVDFDAVFEGLREINFDGLLTSSVLAWEDRAEESSRFQRAKIQELVDRYLVG